MAPAALASEKKVRKFLEDMPPSCSMPLCPVKDVLHTLTDKWSMLVLMRLGTGGTLRFNELRSEVAGISQKMLTVTLKHLEASGLVDRRMYPQIPPKVEYRLTPLGMEFLGHLTVLLDWACRNVQVVGKARKRAVGRAQ